MNRLIYYILVMLLVLSVVGCTSNSQQPISPPLHSATPHSPTKTLVSSTQTPLPPTATLDFKVFEIRSSAFGKDEDIPAKFTCNGDDISPPLEWGDPPEGSQSFVLVVEDISVGNFVHWILFNIPAEFRSLPEAVSKKGHFEDGRQQGMNHLFELGYFGPCPMPGPNQYRFRLYAIDVILDLEDGVMKIPLKAAMKGHILAETEVIGVYP